ncbi:MAG: hypothetical protein Q9227_007912 [Pyrenula ochraceoflavens]
MSPPSSSNYRSSSRAVKIPRREARPAYNTPSTGRRRSARHRAKPESNEDIESDPASISSSQTASYSSSPNDTIQAELSSVSSTQDPSLNSFASLFTTSEDSDQQKTLSKSVKGKGKAVASDNDHLPPPNTLPLLCPARESALGPAMQSSDTYRSIDLHDSDPDETPRLITFTKSGQGFSWNEEVFLPHYMINRYSRGRRKRFNGDMGDDDVETVDIFVTDEEVDRMMP